ncbi:FscB [Rhodobacteraceae bacterium WD3A24]|nr:FscB [Rhodobacteraceae bacterium WD3A24]
MSHVLHLGHQPADVSGILDGHMSTNSQGFDADLDVNAIAFLTVGNSDVLPFSVGFDAPVGDLWFQFRHRTPTTTAIEFNVSDVPFLSFYDASHNLLARLRGQNDATIEAVAEGDSQVVGATSFSRGAAVTYWIDVKLVVGSDITIEFHVDGSLVSSATAANTGGKGKPVRVVFDNQDMHDSTYGDADWYYAHFAALDGVSTIGRRFARQTPDTVGNYDQWAGSLASLGDGDVTTRMTSDTAGQRQNATLAGPTGPAGATIAGVHLKAIAQAGTSGPGNLAGSLRLGVSDYDAASVSLDSEVPGKAIFSWAQNPDTSAAWTDADLPDEIGLLSAP